MVLSIMNGLVALDVLASVMRLCEILAEDLKEHQLPDIFQRPFSELSDQDLRAMHDALVHFLWYRSFPSS